MVHFFINTFMSSGLLTAAIAILLPLMSLVFLFACLSRGLIYYTVKRHEWFAREFEKRVHKFIESEDPEQPHSYSFFHLTKRILEKSFYECFEMRDRMGRRSFDRIMATQDRIFLVKQGCAWLVKDILKQTKYLKWTNETPKLLEITKATFHHNPVFNRIFGIFPISGLNDVINILPGLFVVGGILGTFLGIVQGLPKLGGMNIQDVENTKLIMDRFLNEIAFAMNSSIIGIVFSVIMTLVNSVWSPERVYVSMIDRFENAMDLLWYRSDNNSLTKSDINFDENRDPAEALAEQAVKLEVSKSKRTRDLDNIRGNKVG